MFAELWNTEMNKLLFLFSGTEEYILGQFEGKSWREKA